MSEENETIQLALYASQFYKSIEEAISYDNNARNIISNKVSEEQNAQLTSQLTAVFEKASSIQKHFEQNKHSLVAKKEKALAKSVIQLVDQFVKLSNYAYNDQKLYSFLPSEIRNLEASKKFAQHNANSISKICQLNAYK